jgi:hypothetical protein
MVKPASTPWRVLPKLTWRDSLPVDPSCCVCLGCCAAEFGSSGGTYELPCISYYLRINSSKCDIDFRVMHPANILWCGHIFLNSWNADPEKSDSLMFSWVGVEITSPFFIESGNCKMEYVRVSSIFTCPFPADPIIFCNSNSKILLLLVSVNLKNYQFIAFDLLKVWAFMYYLVCSKANIIYQLKHNFPPRCTQLKNIVFAYIGTVVGKLLSPYHWICYTPDLEVFTPSYILQQKGIYIYICIWV